MPVSYTHLRAHETRHDLVCRLLLEKKMIGKKQIEIKLDGVRVLTIIRQNKVEMFSRNG